MTSRATSTMMPVTSVVSDGVHSWGTGVLHAVRSEAGSEGVDVEGVGSVGVDVEGVGSVEGVGVMVAVVLVLLVFVVSASIENNSL